MMAGIAPATGAPMVNGRIRFVTFRYGHHSPHSGYSRLAEYGAKRYGGDVIRVGKPLSRHVIRERMLWWLAKGTPGYDRASMAAELKVARHLLTERRCIYHYLYGETTYRYAGQLNNVKQNRIVATFHLPPAGIRDALQVDSHLRQLSAVVCLGRNQQPFFANAVDPQRIFVVPLGVDSEYFAPPPSFETRDRDLCVFVGENYRDFPTLRGVIELVAYRRPETRFVGVLPRRSFELVGAHRNLTLRSDIPETELLNLYRSASLMVMPLHDAVANNAILEGMACGLPLIATDVGAVRDYVGAEGAVLIRRADSQGMAEAVMQLLASSSERQRMSERARTQALTFAWPCVLDQLDRVYAAIA